MEKKQTAVEWLAEQLLGVGIKDCPNGIIEQAKEMEKEQIIDAHYEGQCDNTEGYPIEISKQYYNETYNS